MYESAAPISGRLFLFSDSRDAKRLWSAEIHLRFKSHVSFTVGLSLQQEQASCPEGNNF